MKKNQKTLCCYADPKPTKEVWQTRDGINGAPMLYKCSKCHAPATVLGNKKAHYAFIRNMNRVVAMLDGKTEELLNPNPIFDL